MDNYFSNEFQQEKNELYEINSLIMRAIKTLQLGILVCKTNTNPELHINSWPYELGTNHNTTSYSSSTAAMILFVFRKVLNVKQNHLLDFSHDKLKKQLGENEQFKALWLKQLELLYNEIEEDRLISSTFGKDNLFTLGWSLGVINFQLENFNTEINNNRSTLCLDIVIKKSLDKLEKYFVNPYQSECINHFFDTSKNDKTYLEHSFHTLRAVHIFYALKNQKNLNVELKTKINDIENLIAQNIKPFFLGKIHDQLSYSEITNSNFDAAELVFALEGLLRIDDSFDYKSTDSNLLTRIFKVIEDSQRKSPYWRPLKPFVTTQQGMALLPLSVEIANSLIRCCEILENYNEFYFSNYLRLFRNYTDWLKSRAVRVKCELNNGEIEYLYGWHSEHVNKIDIIHPWETSQVIHYLIKCSNMLQEHIGRKCILIANLSQRILEKPLSKIFSDIEEKKKEWETNIVNKFDPIQNNNLYNLQIYRNIGKNYIYQILDGTVAQEICFSMLLFGPPGTGKSTIAKKISQFLNWPLITITPSDFLSEGPNNVEARAKIIFNSLMELEKKIVLFDEIDRLIMDRDNSQYLLQDDVFQFMTPSMLVKINDLRENKKVIFIIATNYEDRIDSAIKRTGRIDNKYVVLPPDKIRRIQILKEFLKPICEPLNIKLEEKITEVTVNSFLQKTALYTIGELNSVINICVKKNIDFDIDTFILELNKIESSAPINLLQYSKRFNGCLPLKDRKLVQEPFKEFLLLLYLLLEVEKIEDVINSHLDVLKGVTLSMFKIKNLKSQSINRENINSTIREKLHDGSEIDIDILNLLTETFDRIINK